MNLAPQFSLRYSRFIALVISCLLIITPPPPPLVVAATITVDEGCDFRQAVRSARDNAAPADSDCEAGDASGHGAADIIVLTGDITVNVAENLDHANSVGTVIVDYAITIEGNGYRISNGGGTDSLLDFGRGVSLTLNNIIISGRSYLTGAVFHSLQTTRLTIRGSVFENNHSSGSSDFAAGVMNLRSTVNADISDSVFSNNTGFWTGVILGNPNKLQIRRSIFENNTGSNLGGALYIGNATIEDSSFIGNSAPVGGAIVASGNLTARNSTFSGNRSGHSIVTAGTGDAFAQIRATYEHVTFSGNTVTNSTGGIVARFYAGHGFTTSHHFLNLHNSVVAGNTGPDIACARNPAAPTQSELNTTRVATSYVEAGGCGAEINLENNGPALLGERQTTRKGQVYYVPQPQVTVTETDDITGEEIEVTVLSPLIDAGASAHCLSRDQLGRSRSVGASCDIGAIEYAPPQPVPPEPVSRGVYRPTEVRSTCLTKLPDSITISPVHDGMQCQMLDDAGIGNQALVEAGYILALDIWGWVGGAGTEVCFSQPGRLLLVDTAPLQRTQIDVPSYQVNGKTCGHIDRTGQVLLLPIPAQAKHAAPGTRELRACWATTLAVLNLRSTPSLGDNVIGLVAEGAVMQTDRRAGDWYRVTVDGLTGWISADYTRTAGVCMPAGGSLAQDSLETLALRSCHATTLAILNLREVPAGRVIGYVPWKARLTVLARKADWVQVDNNGVAGWISADYVTLDGDCG